MRSFTSATHNKHSLTEATTSAIHHNITTHLHSGKILQNVHHYISTSTVTIIVTITIIPDFKLLPDHTSIMNISHHYYRRYSSPPPPPQYRSSTTAPDTIYSPFCSPQRTMGRLLAPRRRHQHCFVRSHSNWLNHQRVKSFYWSFDM